MRPLQPQRITEPFDFGVLDLETQLSAAEVGGWHRADLMRVSCAVLYDSRGDAYRTYTEAQMAELIAEMQQLPLIVGFNIQRFDYRVLSAYTDVNLNGLPTLDILQEIFRHLGYRLSLDHLARVTLDEPKSADGLQALRWWKEGRLQELYAYCQHDVSLTRRIFEYGCSRGYLLFENKAGKKVRIPVHWPPPLQNSHEP
jgi:DEAD/DEAH box helicase domain-containing protein